MKSVNYCCIKLIENRNFNEYKQCIENFIRMSETDSSTTNEDNIRSDSGIIPKCCWVCYGTESDDTLASWVQPCNCKGTSKWVHQACLLRWVDEMQKGNPSRRVTCPQCKTEYILIFPAMGPLVSALDTLEEITHKMCPFIVGGVMLGSLYWTAITYGAVTVMQVVGHEEGMEMFEGADPIALMILLPAVPVLLICGRALRWEDALLSVLRTSCRKIPALGAFLPFGEAEGERILQRASNEQQQTANNSDVNNQLQIYDRYTSPTRILCGALILPTISTVVGSLLFGSVKNNFHRSILGGLTFVVVKGALNIYHKQKLYVRHSTRKILDYNEENLNLYGNRLLNRANNAETVSSNNAQSDASIFAASEQRLV